MPSAVEMSPRKWTLGGEFAAEVLELRAERPMSELVVEPVEDAGCKGEGVVPASSEGVDGGFVVQCLARCLQGELEAWHGAVGRLVGC